MFCSSYAIVCYSPAVGTLFLFTGENTFALRQEKRRWIEEFVAKHGPENFLPIDGSHVTLRQLLDDVSTGPFIATKRLVVIDKVPKLSKEEMQVLLPAVHPDCILLFCDPAPDKRLGGLKYLLTVATVKEFAPVLGKPLLDWMQQESRRHGSAMENAAAATLLSIVGENQDMLAQEIGKLAIAGAGDITSERVSLLAVPSGEQEIWQLTTLLSRGDLPSALRYARLLQQSGEDPYSLWNVLLWLVRCLTAVTLCVAEGERNPTKIASSGGVPFPTARMLVPMAEKIRLSDMHTFLRWAVAADRDLKTGGYKATGEAAQELVALIDELIVRCCGLTQASSPIPSLQSV